MNFNYSLTLFVILNWISISFSFPSGAPADACDALLPRHPGTYATLDQNPYHVVASSDTYGDYDVYESGESNQIKVEIGGAPFKGFIVTAIDPTDGKRIGSFAQVKGSSLLPCSAITHTDNKLKKFATLLWNPPKDGKGKVNFIATIVHSYNQYYPGLVAQVAPKSYEVNYPHSIDWMSSIPTHQHNPLPSQNHLIQHQYFQMHK